ncbi:MAG TPA: hypothetical protein VIW68_13140 [Candidatus Sulfotelmatobacter sp.]
MPPSVREPAADVLCETVSIVFFAWSTTRSFCEGIAIFLLWTLPLLGQGSTGELRLIDRSRGPGDQGDRRPFELLDPDRTTVENISDRLDLIDFGGLFSGNAIGSPRSYFLRLAATF